MLSLTEISVIIAASRERIKARRSISASGQISGALTRHKIISTAIF